MSPVTAVPTVTEHPPDSLKALRGRGDAVAHAPRSRSIGALLLHTFASACPFGILVPLFSLMRGWQTQDNVGPFVLPLVLGFGVSAAPLVYIAVLSRHSFPLAAVVSALAVGVYSIGSGALLTALARLPITDVGVLWHLAG